MTRILVAACKINFNRPLLQLAHKITANSASNGFVSNEILERSL